MQTHMRGFSSRGWSLAQSQDENPGLGDGSEAVVAAGGAAKAESRVSLAVQPLSRNKFDTDALRIFKYTYIVRLLCSVVKCSLSE